jgi:TldD protein
MVEAALNAAQVAGAAYADVRVVHRIDERVVVKNGAVGELERGDDLGMSVRVISSGAWGFASTFDLTPEGAATAAKLAVRIAQASSRVKVSDVELAPEQPWSDRWQTPYQIDPFKVPVFDKLQLLFAVDKVLRERPEIAVAESCIISMRERTWFGSTEGAYIDQEITRCGGGFEVMAVGNGDAQTRSFPASFRGHHKTTGYEIVPALKLLENAAKVRDEAIALLTAEPCPSGRTDLILGGAQLCLQIHESVGHANELDRVLGLESNYAGISFCTTEKQGKFRYGSELVNLVADGTVAGGLATAGYDDDGVAAQRFHVVRDGIHQAYFTNREMAHFIGETRSRGCNRAEGWNNIPIVRIPNLSLMPGTWNLDELIADTESGIFMDVNRSWSIDQMRLNFQFGCEVAWEIKDGKLGRMFKNPNYQGITPEFWGNCDAICDNSHFDLWSVLSCGKGQPGQTAEMSHGSSPARFRNVMCGIGTH